MDIIVENDMNFITYGAYSQQEDCADLAVIYFSENNCTGSGYIINGEILKGSTMFSGEISYILDYFGMSFKEQAASLSRQEIFYMLGKFIIPVIAVINPARIILTGADVRLSTAKSIASFANSPLSLLPTFLKASCKRVDIKEGIHSCKEDDTTPGVYDVSGNEVLFCPLTKSYIL